MSLVLLLKLLLTVFSTLSIAAVAWWARKHPNRSREYPERVRMPKVLLIFGWLCVCVGLLMGLTTFTHPRAPLGALIASVAIFVGGLAFVAMYRNFYVAARDYEVAFRSVLGTEHVIAYGDIAHYSLGMLKGQQFLTVKSVHGVKFSINTSAYDMSPLLRAIDFHQVTGRWPVRVEVPAEGFST
jgi:hypothetical protein